MASFREKIGYGFGDMASSMFWKVFSAYLPFFYAEVFGLPLALASILFLVTKFWDAISDPLMGILADRTQTRWGKYRPWLLFMSIPFALCGILLFTTPDCGETGKAIWAFFTYILMMTIYTGINVPYGSMLGVMTEDSTEKTIFSSYRMFFAYIGSFIILWAWEPMVKFFNSQLGATSIYPGLPAAWQYAMIVTAVVCLVLFLLTFLFTKERVKSKPSVHAIHDLAMLFINGPWWIMLGAILFFNFMNAARYTTIPFYFNSVIGNDVSLTIIGIVIAFSSTIFFLIGEVANLPGVAMATPLSVRFGKKSVFVWSLILLIPLNIAFFFVPNSTEGYIAMLVLQVFVCILTGILSPLSWSMYADISDYAEHHFKSASTGLIFSSSSMAQKFGGAFGSSAVLWLLSIFQYQQGKDSIQTPETIYGIRLLMSWLPAAMCVASLLFIAIYPLTTKRMKIITEELSTQRAAQSEA